jgi:hypothetical protein
MSMLTTRKTRVIKDQIKESIRENMEVIGFDGVHIGIVDCIEGDRIKLKKRDRGHGKHKEHHHYIGTDFVENIEDHKVRLCSDADIAVTFEEEKSGRPAD